MSTRLETPHTANRRGWLGALAAGCGLLLLCVVCGAAALFVWQFRRPQTTAAAQPSVEYVLDASPRMALTADTGQGTRLAVAQSVLDEVIRPSTPSLTAGLRVFGSGKLPDACADTDLLVPLAPGNQTKISASLVAVNVRAAADPAGADSALAAAVVGALRDLSASPGPHTLIVVTGGSDSCSAQAGQLIADEAKRDGIDYQLFVIGYLVTDDQGTAISALVDGAGSGHFISVHSRDQLRAVLQTIQQYAENPAANNIVTVLATAAAEAPTVTSPGGTNTPTPTAAVAAAVNTETATATPTATDTATPTLTPASTISPTPDSAPKVISFLARFDPVQRSTFYSVTVSSTVATVAGPSVTYHWSNTNSCGQFTGVDTPIAVWHHPDIPGSCPNEPVHPGIITVVVTNTFGATQCDYAGGSAPGNIIKCHDVSKP